MEKELKEFRVKIDGLAQLTQGLMVRWSVDASLRKEGESREALFKRAKEEGFAKSNDDNSVEIDNAKHDLYFAKFWCGKALGALGTPSPYVNDGKRKEVADIEPTDDKATPVGGWSGRNHIEKVDWLRQEIQKVIDQGLLIYENNLNPSITIPNLIAAQIHVHLIEARGWLGFELERIREKEEI